jgi:cytochrome oxidase Cu insertion factor (SCO1/SenC/PrrC family)
MPNRALFRTLAVVSLAAAVASAADVPRPSPDFEIGMNSGEPIRISQYKGKVCVLAFILTTCPHCQKTVGYLSAIQKEYGPRGLQVVASAVDDMGKMNVPDFIKRFQPAFPVGFSNQNDADGYLQHPVIYRLFVPQLVFIDRQGTIQAQYGGDDKFLADDQDKHIREQIEALLKDAPAKARPTKKR